LLKPNGWLQMVEFHAVFQSDSGREAPFLSRWWDWYSQKLLQMGKNPRIASQLKHLMLNAGFTDVRYYVPRLPIGNWDPGSSPFFRWTMCWHDSLLTVARSGAAGYPDARRAHADGERCLTVSLPRSRSDAPSAVR
jgi:hypothetical protein